MRLYHFLDEKFGLSDIRLRRLKIARIEELNDPFEFASVNLQNEAIRRAFGRMKAEMATKRGLLCFSTKWSNPVQWSHYSDRHRGICLGFDVAERSVGAVSYSRRRLVVELEHLQRPRELSQDYVHQLLFTKYSHWRYENEFRAFVTLDDIEPATGLYFAEFSPDLALKEVIVGARSELTKSQLTEALGSMASEVSLTKARLAFSTFSVVKQRKAALWA